MPVKKTKDASTEEKILEAARKVFTHKGFSGTRTRDIAEEAGINLALLNYYFRSKKKLFDQVMAEKMQEFFGNIAPIFNNPASSLETKISEIVAFYTDMLLDNPDLPLFVLSEIRNNPKGFAQSVRVKKILTASSFFEQVAQRRPDVNPLQFMLSMMGMIVFPYIGKPVFVSSNTVEQEEYKKLLRERSELVPKWIMAMIDSK